MLNKIQNVEKKSQFEVKPKMANNQKREISFFLHKKLLNKNCR